MIKVNRLKTCIALNQMDEDIKGCKCHSMSHRVTCSIIRAAIKPAIMSKLALPWLAWANRTQLKPH